MPLIQGEQVHGQAAFTAASGVSDLKSVPFVSRRSSAIQIQRSTHVVIAIMTLDLLILLLAQFAATYLRQTLPFGPQILEVSEWMPIVRLLTIAVWMITMGRMRMYDPSERTYILTDLYKLTQVFAFSLLVMGGILYFSYRDVSRYLIFYFAFTSLLAMSSYRIILHLSSFMVRANVYGRHRVLVVGQQDKLISIVKTLRQYGSMGVEVVMQITTDTPVPPSLDNLPLLVKNQSVDEVILALPPAQYSTIEAIVAALQTQAVQISVMQDHFALAMYRANITDYGDFSLMQLRQPALNGYQRLVKRIFDVTVASLMLLAVAPIMLVVALLLKIDSPGSVIFKQERVGENRKRFTMYKFRTMVTDAERLIDYSIFKKQPGDERVTRFGKFLRSSSLDELPQLFNVILGEMSLVGPRPEMPYYVDQYRPWQNARFAVPPGLTGWWQVNGRSDKLMSQHTEDDLYYVQNYSIFLDIQILLMTIPAVLTRKGAF